MTPQAIFFRLDREGGKIATGLEFNRAAHLLATFMNDTIVKGDVPGIIIVFRHVLKLFITDLIFAWLCECFSEWFLYLTTFISQSLYQVTVFLCSD